MTAALLLAQARAEEAAAKARRETLERELAAAAGEQAAEVAPVVAPAPTPRVRGPVALRPPASEPTDTARAKAARALARAGMRVTP